PRRPLGPVPERGGVVHVEGGGWMTSEPGTRDQGPGTRDQGPGTRDQGPGTRDQGPGTRDQGPGTRGRSGGSEREERRLAAICHPAGAPPQAGRVSGSTLTCWWPATR